MSDTSTRSGMLWEVKRILKELKETDSLPQVLLMENVPQVHSVDNTPDFNKWQIELTKLGYKNYWEDLIATDYGIPQVRNRCFMVSILGDYNYTFPKPIPLEKKLKDMLEDKVDKKYYISEDLMKHIQKTKEEHKEYTQYERYNGAFEQLCRVWKDKAPTLHTKSSDIKIYDKNKIRYLTCKEAFRLMGVKDEDFENVAKNQSDSSLFHLAGDSIVVNVLMAIFKEMI
jgi:DNA (cytosine-5)-methyltransferase 1